MSLSEQLQQMQTMLAQMSAVLQNLQEQVEKLEGENQRLRQEITPVLEHNKSNAGGQKALQQLYDEGYHVCPTYFGKEHDGGCLFCMEVLQNVTK